MNPVIMMVWLGAAYAAGASALWPMVSFILPHHVLGTAYGTMTAIQNLGMRARVVYCWDKGVFFVDLAFSNMDEKAGLCVQQRGLSKLDQCVL